MSKSRIVSYLLDILFILIILAISRVGIVVVDHDAGTAAANISIERAYFYTYLAGLSLTFAIGIVNFNKVEWRTSVINIVPFLIVIASSIFTTVNFSTTSNHALRLIAVILGSHAYIRLRGPEAAVRMIGISLIIINILSFGFAIGLPEIGRHSGAAGVELAHVGDWKGITTHKNSLGRVAAVTALLLLAYADLFRWPKYVSLFLGLVCLANLVGSKSGTNIVAFGIVGVIYLSFLRKDISTMSRLLSGLVLALGSILLPWTVLPLLDLLGKDTSASGRTDIWGFCWDVIISQPWYGYGFDAGAEYWRPVMQKKLFSSAIDAHSAYIQTIMDTGWLGLGTIILGFAGSLIGAFRVKRSNDEQTSRANSAFGLVLILAAIVGLTEISPLSITSDVGFVTYIAIIGISIKRASPSPSAAMVPAPVRSA